MNNVQETVYSYLRKCVDNGIPHPTNPDELLREMLHDGQDVEIAFDLDDNPTEYAIEDATEALVLIAGGF